MRVRSGGYSNCAQTAGGECWAIDPMGAIFVLSSGLGETASIAAQRICQDVVKLLKGGKEPAIVHTDQGSVFASMAYNELIKDTNIVRSMSRAGKPTDNPVNEALNGWIKEEIISDFNLNVSRHMPLEDFEDIICKYVKYYNMKRPCYAIGYDTPDNFCKRYYDNDMLHKDTFKNRILTTEPKFVQERRKKAAVQSVGQSCPLTENKMPDYV